MLIPGQSPHELLHDRMDPTKGRQTLEPKKRERTATLTPPPAHPFFPYNSNQQSPAPEGTSGLAANSG